MQPHLKLQSRSHNIDKWTVRLCRRPNALTQNSMPLIQVTAMARLMNTALVFRAEGSGPGRNWHGRSTGRNCSPWLWPKRQRIIELLLRSPFS